MWRELPLVLGLLALLLLGILDSFPFKRSSGLKAVADKDEDSQGVGSYLDGIIRRLPARRRGDFDRDERDRIENIPASGDLRSFSVYNYRNVELENSRNSNEGPENIGPAFKSKSIHLVDFDGPNGAQASVTRAAYDALVNNNLVYNPQTDQRDDFRDRRRPDNSETAVYDLIGLLERPTQTGGLLNHEGKGVFANPLQKLRREGEMSDVQIPPGQPNVGHTIGQHVLSDAYDRLLSRRPNPNRREGEEDATSHWQSLESANRDVATTLTDNADETADWLRNLNEFNNDLFNPQPQDVAGFQLVISSAIDGIQGEVYRRVEIPGSNPPATVIERVDPTHVKVILGLFDTWNRPNGQGGFERIPDQFGKGIRFFPRIITAFPERPDAAERPPPVQPPPPAAEQPPAAERPPAAEAPPAAAAPA